jgi:hypothetical protein
MHLSAMPAQVRQEASGDVVFKDTFDSPIAAVLTCDLRLDGREQAPLPHLTHKRLLSRTLVSAGQSSPRVRVGDGEDPPAPHMSRPGPGDSPARAPVLDSESWRTVGPGRGARVRRVLSDGRGEERGVREPVGGCREPARRAGCTARRALLHAGRTAARRALLCAQRAAATAGVPCQASPLRTDRTGGLG